MMISMVFLVILYVPLFMRKPRAVRLKSATLQWAAYVVGFRLRWPHSPVWWHNTKH